MTRLAVALLSATLLLAEPPGGDVGPLEGTWKLKNTSLTGSGREDKDRSETLVVQGRQFTKSMRSVQRGSITLGLPREPQAFEKVATSSDVPRTTRGLFELRGDTYRECMAPGRLDEMPKSFSPDATNRYILNEWKRLRRPEAGKGEAADGIDGTWTLASVNIAGTPGGEWIKGLTLTVERGRYTLENHSEQKGTLRVDPSKSPKWVDFEFTEPATLKGNVSSGIYEIDGDTLAIDRSLFGKPRPVEFGARSWAFQIYERVKPLSATSRAGAGPAPDPWVGQRVVDTIGTESMVGTPVAGRDERDRGPGRALIVPAVYRVERSVGPWLWLVAEKGGARGWTRSSNVVPLIQAFDRLAGLIRADPKDGTAYIRRGLLWLEAREPDKAIDDFNAAIRLGARPAEAYSFRGFAWSEKQERDRAIADYTEAIRLNPGDTKAYNNRGLAWYEKHEPDRAIADFTEAIRINPKYARAYDHRGLAWDEKNEVDRAIADYTEAIRLDPGNVKANNNRGTAWVKKNEPDRAIADFSEAIRLDPTFAQAYRHRGVAQAAKGSYDKALADLAEAIRLNPGDAKAYEFRARIRSICPDPGFRDVRKAIDDARRACELTAWKDPFPIEMLAAAIALSGDTATAAQWQERANALFTDEGQRERGEAVLQRYRDGNR
jgi:uncharacterized protein (TIGR03067 family)